MANKQPTTSADIRELSQQLRLMATAYEEQAARMDEKEIPAGEFALQTMQEAVLKRVNSNINNLTSRINDLARQSRKIKKRDAAIRSDQKRDRKKPDKA